MRRTALALFLLLACAAAHAAEEHWFSVHLDGRKIGHMLQSRDIEAEQVVSRQLLSLTVERAGEALTIESDERAWETRDGLPLAFEVRIDSAGSVTRARGEVEHAHLRVEVEQQGRVQRQHQVWPEDALLTEGQRLAAERAGLAPGTSYTYQAFDPGSLQAMRVLTRVGAAETVAIHGQRERLVPVAQTMWLGGGRIESQGWVDPATQALRRLRFPAIGLQLEVLACERACALAPDQPADVLAAMLVPAPHNLRRADLGEPLRYRLGLKRGEGVALGVPPGQTLEVQRDADSVRLRVDPAGDSRAPPTLRDTAATRWLQSDTEEVIALARKAVRDARSPRERMRRLEAFVREYIEIKSLRVGYASASEVVRDREGDCTEHAVLLAAMARALGIPARVATGIAYSPVYNGQRNVFVPHAWVLAWVDGRWQGFDAATRGFDAGHIAFATGDGDPYRFYEGIELLGSVEMLGVQRIGRRELARLARQRRGE